MKLIPEARRVAWRSYSMWANYLGLAALIVPEAIYWRWGIDMNPRTLWFAGVALILFGTLGRLIAQPGNRSWLRIIVLAVFTLTLIGLIVSPAIAQPVTEAQFKRVAVPLVAKWEGKSNTAYLDRIASPPVWTVCYGETRGVQAGDSYTDQECADMLGMALVDYRNGLHEAFTPETIARRLNTGNIRGGCEAIGWWNKAGGRVIRGLANRRADEVALCLRGA